MRKILHLACLLFLTATATAQEFTTYTYLDDLQLDLFLPENKGVQVPIVIFVHGGGFSGGERTSGHTLARTLARRGIACASISYTLYMKGRSQDWGCDGILTEKIKTLQLAANDTWAATRFLADNAGRFAIDPNRIFLAGSSAGAEAVLHAAFWPRDKMKLKEHKLGNDFTYAGVISGAGALVDINLVTARNQLPLMLLHGENDPLVPYATAAHHFCAPTASGWLMLFGALPLADRIATLGGSYELVTHAGAGHEIAGYYFAKEPGRVADFVERTGRGGNFQIRETVAGK